MKAIKQAGFRAVICNRPDGEGAKQPSFEEPSKEAKKLGLEARYLPVGSGKVTDAEGFEAATMDLPCAGVLPLGHALHHATLWSLSRAKQRPLADNLAAAKAARYEMAGVAHQIANGGKTPTDTGDASYDVLIVGAGAGGIAAAASLKARKPILEIAIIDPVDIHYHQPGWTMVGGSVFEAQDTARTYTWD